jgi:hypothetical protein
MARRLQPFVDAGLLPTIPTRWQRFQGQVAMVAYVVYPAASDRARYAGTPLGHPILRQVIQMPAVGRDHFRIGDGLGASLAGLVRHLLVVFHEGSPSYDIQLIQTHEGGLDALRQGIEAVETGATPAPRRLQRRIDLVIPNASHYRRGFLEPGGFIDQAARFEYPAMTSQIHAEPQDVATLIDFLRYCAATYPATPADIGWWAVPKHLALLFTTRMRRALRQSRGL